MKEPTTIKGYISLIKLVDKIDLTNLKGYEKLSDKEKIALSTISAEISNNLNEM